MKSISMTDMETIRFEHAWQSLAIWGDMSNTMYLSKYDRIEE